MVGSSIGPSFISFGLTKDNQQGKAPGVENHDMYEPPTSTLDSLHRSLRLAVKQPLGSNKALTVACLVDHQDLELVGKGEQKIQSVAADVN